MRPSVVTWDDVSHATGKAVRIAIIDSGVEMSHPAFYSRTIHAFKTEQVWNRVYRVISDASPRDQFGHGTAVADIVCRHAPEATVSCVQVLDSSLRASSPKIIAAIGWAIEQQYDIINCSFGAGGTEFLLKYKEIVDAAFRSGVILVAACNNVDFRQPEYPGAFATVISTDHGPLDGLNFVRRRGELVEFVAAGRSLRLPWKGGGYRTVMGSSFAAPHLSALCARIRELRPAWNMVEMKASLYRLAEPEGDVGSIRDG